MPEHSEPGSQTVETIRPATPNELAAQRLISRSDTALAFARVCNLNRAVFDRLGRYEVALWKQLSQTLVVLDLIRRENGRPLNNGSQLNGTVTHPKQQRNEHP